MRIWWCQEHGDNGNEERCAWQWISDGDDGPCRMVPMRLIPDNAETVVVEKIDGEWPEWAVQAIYDGPYTEQPREILDALAGKAP